jgi:lysophospholipase L1-like esterase
MISLQEISNTIKSKGKYWIVFTGDSKTSCEWVHPNWGEIIDYVLKEELEKMYGNDWRIPSWGVRCFNFGYDGATTKDILDRVKDINIIAPDLMISIMGSNDMKMGISTNEHVANIKEIINKVNTKVVWSTSILSIDEERNGIYKNYANALLEIPENENLKLIDMLRKFENFPLDKFFTFKDKNAADLTHPNQLGNAFIAKVILKEVFGIDFDPEKYWRETLAGEKYPGY